MDQHLDALPEEISNSLTHLEIYAPQKEDPGRLSRFFQHTSNLESLIITGKTGLWPVASSLYSNRKNLPRLSSFHLSIAYPYHIGISKISKFIRDMESLKRLCLRLRTKWSNFSRILLSIKNLPALTTLGLHTGDDKVDLEFLALHLPPTLENLHLALYWNASTMNILSLAPLVFDLQVFLPHTDLPH
jgi:hypothetical protein